MFFLMDFHYLSLTHKIFLCTIINKRNRTTKSQSTFAENVCLTEGFPEACKSDVNWALREKNKYFCQTNVELKAMNAI